MAEKLPDVNLDFLEDGPVHHTCASPSVGLTDTAWKDTLTTAVVSKEFRSAAAGGGTVAYDKKDRAVGGKFEAQSANAEVAIAFASGAQTWSYTFLGLTVGVSSHSFDNSCTYTLLTPRTGVMTWAAIDVAGSLPAGAGAVSSSGSLNIV